MARIAILYQTNIAIKRLPCKLFFTFSKFLFHGSRTLYNTVMYTYNSLHVIAHVILKQEAQISNIGILTYSNRFSTPHYLPPHLTHKHPYTTYVSKLSHCTRSLNVSSDCGCLLNTLLHCFCLCVITLKYQGQATALTNLQKMNQNLKRSNNRRLPEGERISDHDSSKLYHIIISKAGGQKM